MDEEVQVREGERDRPIGLVLGAGGARGLAHIGVLKVLRRAGVPVDLVVGASMGSLVGAAFAAGVPPEQMERDVGATRWLDYFSQITLHGSGLIGLTRIKAALDRLFEGRTFADLEVPLAVVAVSLGSGEVVTLREGPVADAVLASIAVPIVFPPVPWGDDLLVDGGVLAPVPVEVARALGARRVIAVDADTRADEIFRRPWLLRVTRSFVAPLVRGGARAAGRISRTSIACWLVETLAAAPKTPISADVLIRPEYGRTRASDFHRTRWLVALGEAAALNALPQVLSLAARAA